ncbi:hypothetical protein PI124_g24624 [Phytophthora idaei]|nr:hypothetical protein PI124_g24624 [Phytophthora idaei]
MAISRETGKSVEESPKQIWRVDSRGLVVESRKESLQPHKLPYAHDAPECSNLVETLDRIKPTALIGVCTIAKAFNEEVCQKMSELNEHPIIFALSNPTSKAECTAKEAYTFTNGNCIFASGSPFDPVEINGKLCVPGQGNNSYIFPGRRRCWIDSRERRDHDHRGQDAGWIDHHRRPGDWLRLPAAVQHSGSVTQDR